MWQKVVFVFCLFQLLFYAKAVVPMEGRNISSPFFNRPAFVFMGDEISLSSDLQSVPVHQKKENAASDLTNITVTADLKSFNGSLFRQRGQRRNSKITSTLSSRIQNSSLSTPVNSSYVHQNSKFQDYPAISSTIQHDSLNASDQTIISDNEHIKKVVQANEEHRNSKSELTNEHFSPSQGFLEAKLKENPFHNQSYAVRNISSKDLISDLSSRQAENYTTEYDSLNQNYAYMTPNHKHQNYALEDEMEDIADKSNFSNDYRETNTAENISLAFSNKNSIITPTPDSKVRISTTSAPSTITRTGTEVRFEDEIKERFSKYLEKGEMPVRSFKNETRNRSVAFPEEFVDDTRISVEIINTTQLENIKADQKETVPSNTYSPKDDIVLNIGDYLNGRRLNSTLIEKQDTPASISNAEPNVNFSQSSSFEPFSPYQPSNSSNNNEFDISIPIMANADNIINRIIERITSERPMSGLESKDAFEPLPTIDTNHQTLYPNSSEPADSGVHISENRGSENEVGSYTVILPNICTENSTMLRLMELINNVSNNEQATKEHFACQSLKNNRVTRISKELSAKIYKFLKEKVKHRELGSIEVHSHSSNSTVFFDLFSFDSRIGTFDDGIYVPKLAVIISSSVVVGLVVSLLCITIYRKRCRRRSTSISLYDMPHLNLKSDFELTHIPRPVISYPDNNREFLSTYSHDSYRSGPDDSVLNEHHFSGNGGRTYEVVGSEIYKPELHTFGRSPRRKQDRKGSSSQGHSSTNTWDRRKENGYIRKNGIDNAGYNRRW